MLRSAAVFGRRPLTVLLPRQAVFLLRRLHFASSLGASPAATVDIVLFFLLFLIFNLDENKKKQKQKIKPRTTEWHVHQQMFFRSSHWKVYMPYVTKGPLPWRTTSYCSAKHCTVFLTATPQTVEQPASLQTRLTSAASSPRGID